MKHPKRAARSAARLLQLRVQTRNGGLSQAAALPFSKSLGDNNEEVVMQVQLEIPEDLARQLAADPSGVMHAALEAVALEGVRSGKFTVSQARRLLGIRSRYEMDGFLKAHGVFLDLTLDDVRKDSEVALAFSR
jgi:hypothetical protein